VSNITVNNVQHIGSNDIICTLMLMSQHQYYRSRQWTWNFNWNSVYSMWCMLQAFDIGHKELERCIRVSGGVW